MKQTKQIGHLITATTIVVTFDGSPIVIQRDNSSKSTKVLELIKKKKFTELKKFLLAKKAAVAKMAKKAATPKAGKAKSYRGFRVDRLGNVFLAGEKKQVHKVIAERLVQFAEQNLPYMPLVKFWKNLRKNPSARSVEQLYSFLEKNHHPLTEDGCFLAYKRVDKQTVKGKVQYPSFHKNPDGSLLLNLIGKRVRMDRKKVNANPHETCSTGLHVASYSYAHLNYNSGSGTLLEVKVNPRDVVSVPTDYSQMKMRVCEYVPLGEASSELRSSLVSSRGSSHQLSHAVDSEADEHDDRVWDD